MSFYIIKEGKEISSFQKLYSCKPNIELIHPFGCYVFTHISQKNKIKLMSKAYPAIYFSLSKKINGYILYDPVKKTIFESSSMIFDKYVFGVLNLLKHINRRNIPHYFNTYLNEKFIDFLKLSDYDDVLNTNTNSIDCIYENSNDFVEIVIDNNYPIDVERENKIDHSTFASVNLHSKHIALNEKTYSMNVYSNDDDNEMVLLNITLLDFT